MMIRTTCQPNVSAIGSGKRMDIQNAHSLTRRTSSFPGDRVRTFFITDGARASGGSHVRTVARTPRHLGIRWHTTRKDVQHPGPGQEIHAKRCAEAPYSAMAL